LICLLESIWINISCLLKNILKDVGFSDEVIIYASSHHLNYFSDFDQNKLPVECNIIEIADKFNAISQSEGIRIYAQRKSHSEAMEIIIKGFKGVFDASSQEDCFKSRNIEDFIK